MSAVDEISAYHNRLSPADQAICEKLRSVIDAELPEAESKIWHAHPVWFLDGNPVVGYSRLKHCIRLLFWSGQGFDEDGLKPEGKFKAAEARFNDVAEIDEEALRQWLGKARVIQWDYKNIMKNKGLRPLIGVKE